MKKVLFLALTAFFLSAAQVAKTQTMIISVVEYMEILYGNDSKMFISYPDGKQEEVQLKGLFEVTGLVRPKHLKGNDEAVMKKLNDLQKQGWEIKHVNMGVRPEVPKSSGAGCLITRYILEKRN